MVSVIIAILVCLGLSAFCSGMEIAFVASNRLKTEIDRKNSSVFGHIMGRFTRHPGQYITTILVGNNIALVVYSLNMTLLLKMLAQRCGWGFFEDSIIIDTLISTIVIIFAAEYIPKAVVRVSPNFYMRLLAVPVYLLYVVLYPIARISTWLSVSILRIFNLKLPHHSHLAGFDRMDLTNLVEDAVDNEYEGHNEHEMKLFQNALEFSDVRVRDCMVRRVDIEAIEAAEAIEELSRRFVESKYSRIFVYEGSIDNITGYVNSKSLFTHPERIADVLMKVEYVTESLPAQKLLTGMIKRHQSVAVVIDEFGGTAGIVSMEDALEEIFGEIEDEHDSRDMVEKEVGDGEWVFSCRLEIDYLNERYGLEIPESDEYDTLAGYIILKNDSIPSQGDTLSFDGMEIRVLRTKASRVDLARVKIVDD